MLREVLVEECRKHSRVALQVLEDTLLNEVIEPQLKTLARQMGFNSVKELLEHYEERPEELSSEKLQAILRRHRMIAPIIGLLAGWVKKRGGLKYEEALEFTRECRLEKTYKFLASYPNTAKKIIEALNKIVTGGS
jgi:hypothetical protein